MIATRRHFVASLAAGATLALGPRARAQTTDDFLRNKTVRILVGSPPGGGYDLYARMLAPHFAQRTGSTAKRYCECFLTR